MPFQKIDVIRAERRKQNCYARKRELIELIFVEFGSIEKPPRVQRISYERAIKITGNSSIRCAYLIVFRYKQRGGFLRHPIKDPKP